MDMQDFSVKFNPHPRVVRVSLETGQSVFVVDDALDRPEHLVALADAVKDEFVQVPGNPFPGSQLLMDDEFSGKLDAFFRLHIRSLLDCRRSLHMFSRLSRVTLLPNELDARQRICHRDIAGVDPRHSISASVLYLFDDASLGGTVFFAPAGSSQETEKLVQDASTLDKHVFAKKYGWPASYMAHSNMYFKVIGRVPARRNRIIFYDGNIFHSSDIRHPEKLIAADSVGRLTINGFFNCTRRAV